MKRLIIEVYPDGTPYAYVERGKHFKAVEPTRQTLGRNRRTLESLDHECRLDPGDYIVLPLAKVVTTGIIDQP